MSFYENCRQCQKIKAFHVMKVHEWNENSPPKAGRLYQQDGGIFILTEDGNALVFHDDQVQAMIREGLIDPENTVH